MIKECNNANCEIHKVFGFEFKEIISCSECSSEVVSSHLKFFQYFEISYVLKNINQVVLDYYHQVPINKLNKAIFHSNSEDLENCLTTQMRNLINSFSSNCTSHNVARERKISISENSKYFCIVFC